MAFYNMTMSERFNIKLDNMSAVFILGQTITGHVEMLVNQHEQFTKVDLKAEGNCQTHWVQREVRTGPNEDGVETSYYTNIDYTSKEDYLGTVFPLAKKEGIFQGQHRLPFSIALPRDIPPSFEGEHGTISYGLKVVFRRTDGFSFDCTFPFVVRGFSDLNTLPGALVTTEITKRKWLRYMSCLGGWLCVIAWISPSGYVPGQTLHFRTYIENDSGKRLRGLLELVRLETYRSVVPKRDSRTSVKCLDKHVLDSEKASLSDVALTIPEVVPSSLPFCSNIDVAYQLRFSVKAGTWSRKLKITMGLIIGTVPHASREPTAPALERDPNAPPSMDLIIDPVSRASLGPTAPALERDQDAPPSYDEIMTQD